MMFELTLSRHLVKPLFSILLMIGATIGVACLLMVLSLFENYYLSMEKVFMGIHPHIEVHTVAKKPADIEKIISQLKSDYPEIKIISPALYEKVTIEIAEVTVNKASCVRGKSGFQALCRETHPQAQGTVIRRTGFDILTKASKEVFLKGISLQNNETVMEIKDIVSGYNDLDRLSQTENENGYPMPAAFFMEGLSYDAVLDDFLLTMPEKGEQHHYRLLGILDLGRKTGHLPLLITSLSNVQNLLNKKDAINTIEIKLAKPYHSPTIANRMQADLGESFQVHDWTEKEQASFAFLQTIKWIAIAILFSISIVAAISVYSTLLLAVMQNRKKIAILKALGIKNRSIYLIFISRALTIGIIGLIAGSLLGYAGSEWLISHFTEDLQKLGLNNPQIEISGGDLLLTTVLTLMLFMLMAIIPAWQAATIEPADNLQ